VGQGAVSYSHSGERFVLGWGADFFGIWDRAEPGAPIASYPRTDVGWEAAWRDFSGREQRFVAVGPGGSPAPGTAGVAAYRPTAGLAKAVVVMVGIVAVLAILTIAARAGLIARVHEFQQGNAFRGSVTEAGRNVDDLARLTFFAILATGAVWITWHHRAHANRAAFGVTGLRFTPGFVIAWWLVPFANLVLPAMTTAETWKASASAAEGQPSEWTSRRAPALLKWWWAAWLARIPLGALAVSIAGQENHTLNDVLARAYVGVATDALLIVAAALAIAVVRSIQRLQDQAASVVAMAGVS